MTFHMPFHMPLPLFLSLKSFKLRYIGVYWMISKDFLFKYVCDETEYVH